MSDDPYEAVFVLGWAVGGIIGMVVGFLLALVIL